MQMDIAAIPRVAPQEVWQDRASLLTVIAHPARLSILEALCERPLCVKQINAVVPLAQAQLSQHMASLRKADLVACHACGTKRCYYILRPTLVKRLIPLLRQEHPVQPREHDAVIRAAKRGSQAISHQT
jgi:DNA-binding transcriptional ArsR family regulator